MKLEDGSMEIIAAEDVEQEHDDAVIEAVREEAQNLQIARGPGAQGAQGGLSKKDLEMLGAENQRQQDEKEVTLNLLAELSFRLPKALILRKNFRQFVIGASARPFRPVEGLRRSWLSWPG